MGERIIIDFEGEEKKKNENRIIIELDDVIKEGEPQSKEKNYEDIILNSKINSYYRGNSQLSNFFESDLKFPEGIEQGFRKRFSINLKDEFYNCILENNQYIILSSKNGSVYLINRFTGGIEEKIFFEYESFEKTGLVYENIIFINSLKKIFNFYHEEDGEPKYKEIYSSDKEFFIWSNLNRYKDYILFIEFTPSIKNASLKIIDIKNSGTILEYAFAVHNFVSDKICIANGCAYVLTDTNLLIYDLEKMMGEIRPLEIKVDENSFIYYLNYRIYITSYLNELYYLDLPPINYKFKYSGIKNSYINSIGGFDDNIFLGTLDGWKYYKSNGFSVYNFEDEYENKIECMNRNVLIVSQKNKIVFYNLNRFQEAEGYVIASKDKNESVEIVSAIISKNEIFVLTKNGILEAFSNDKLNIHV